MAKTIDAEADALLAKYGQSAPTGPRCGVEKSEWRALIEALAERKISSTRIAEIIWTEKQQRVPANSIQRHRRQACSCGR